MQHWNMRNPANTVAMTTQPEDHCFTAHNSSHRLCCRARTSPPLLPFFFSFPIFFFFCSFKATLGGFVQIFFFQRVPELLRQFIQPALQMGERCPAVWVAEETKENVTSGLEMSLVLNDVAAARSVVSVSSHFHHTEPNMSTRTEIIKTKHE